MTIDGSGTSGAVGASAPATGHEPALGAGAVGGAPVAIRAQLLATEHWSLLATRGMTWSEVMSRIAIHLTILSASLVVLALVAQASGFGTAFDVLSIGLASAVLVLGMLTGVRITNASLDDHALVVGMNRLRAAYVAIDPGIEEYLLTSWHDDEAGIMTTYAIGYPRSTVAHVVGGTSVFVNVVNAIVAGTLGALIASAAGAPTWAVAVVGSAAGVVFLGTVSAINARMFARPP